MTESEVVKLKGWIEWRHPLDGPDDEPILGYCYAREATLGLGGWWVAWTGLSVDGIGGLQWTRDLSTFTPLGPGAKAILDFVRARIEEDRRTLPEWHYLYPRSA